MFIVGRITEPRVFGELIIFYVIGVAIVTKNLLAKRGYQASENSHLNACDATQSLD
jgi:hypothetical protein